MTTITIKNGESLSQTEFENLDELRAYLAVNREEEKEFSDEFMAKIKRRSEALKSGEAKAIPLEEVRMEMSARIDP